MSPRVLSECNLTATTSRKHPACYVHPHLGAVDARLDEEAAVLEGVARRRRRRRGHDVRRVLRRRGRDVRRVIRGRGRDGDHADALRVRGLDGRVAGSRRRLAALADVRGPAVEEDEEQRRGDEGDADRRADAARDVGVDGPRDGENRRQSPDDDVGDVRRDPVGRDRRGRARLVAHGLREVVQPPVHVDATRRRHQHVEREQQAGEERAEEDARDDRRRVERVDRERPIRDAQRDDEEFERGVPLAQGALRVVVVRRHGDDGDGDVRGRRGDLDGRRFLHRTQDDGV